MLFLVFIGGLVLGALLMFAVFVLSQRTDIQRTINQITQPVIAMGNKAFIAGLSDEESSFAESINKNHDVQLT